MQSIFMIGLAAIAVARGHPAKNLHTNLGDLPLQNPDLFGGDMLGVEVVDRNVIPQPHRRWPRAVVPYIIDSSVASYTDLILSAMKDYEDRTCIRFEQRKYAPNYIRLFQGQGCYSMVGMVGGQQQVSLGQGCMFKGIIIHELGHAIGFFHEHNRSDRDEYLIIYWNNIESGMENQFLKMRSHENILMSNFDYDSIMLYSNTAFSRDYRSYTMAARSGVPLLEQWEKPGLSKDDIYRVNKMYNCSVTGSIPRFL